MLTVILLVVIVDGTVNTPYLSPGYITNNGEIVDFTRLELLCVKIGKKENEILQEREDNMRKLRYALDINLRHL